MAYNINKFDGSLFASVNDSEVNQQLPITLIGKNYAGYGEFQNENFLFLLENFARDLSPSNPIRGQLWYDTVNKKIKFHTGERINGTDVWKTAGGVEYSGTAPLSPTKGDLWYDSVERKLKMRNNSLTWTYVGSGNIPVYSNIDERDSVERPENNLPVSGSLILILNDGAGNARVQCYVDETRNWINLN